MFGRLRRRLAETYDADGLTPSQMSVPSRLDQDGPACASSLAAAERVRPQSMAATLAALDERGLVRRGPDPADGRWRAGEEWPARSLGEHFTEPERQAAIDGLVLLDRLYRT